MGTRRTYSLLSSGNCQMHKICQNSKYIFMCESGRKVALRGERVAFQFRIVCISVFTVLLADFPQFSWLPIYPIMIMSVLGHLLVRPAVLRSNPPAGTQQLHVNQPWQLLFQFLFVYDIARLAFPASRCRIHPKPVRASLVIGTQHWRVSTRM